MKKKNVLIYGVSRSGKTTLAKMLNYTLGYNTIVLDNIVGAFGTGLKEVGIDFFSRLEGGESVKNCETKFNSFLSAYLNVLKHESESRSALNFCVEGVYFHFDKLKEKVNLNDFVVVAIGYSKLSARQIADNMKKYDKPFDWSFSLSDKARSERASYYFKMNKVVEEAAKKHGIAFFDVSQNREEVLKEALEYIKNNI